MTDAADRISEMTRVLDELASRDLGCSDLTITGDSLLLSGIHAIYKDPPPRPPVVTLDGLLRAGDQS